MSSSSTEAIVPSAGRILPPFFREKSESFFRRRSSIPPGPKNFAMCGGIGSPRSFLISSAFPIAPPRETARLIHAGGRSKI